MAARLREAVRVRLRRRAPVLQGLAIGLRAALQPASAAPPLPDAIRAALGCQVRAGPFAGLTYETEAFGSAGLPKLVGCYEAELHPLVERLVARGYRRIVNVGAAEGYYAVGLARRLPQAQVVAVEPVAAARRACRRLAAANGVAARVRTAALAWPARLVRWAGPGGLIVMDCEGAEVALLDPARAPGLRAVDILVEVHDFLEPDLDARLLARFAGTHDVEIVEQAPREAARWLQGLDLPPEAAAAALDERRPRALRWAWLSARRR